MSAILFLYQEVLKQDIDWLEDVVRGKKPSKPTWPIEVGRPRNREWPIKEPWQLRGEMPVVLTREEVKAVVGRLSGVKWLLGNLLYGSGLRLMEVIVHRVAEGAY